MLAHEDGRQHLILYKYSFSYKNSGYGLNPQQDHFLYGIIEKKEFCQNKIGCTLSHCIPY